MEKNNNIIVIHTSSVHRFVSMLQRLLCQDMPWDDSFDIKLSGKACEILHAVLSHAEEDYDISELKDKIDSEDAEIIQELLVDVVSYGKEHIQDLFDCEFLEISSNFIIMRAKT